MRLGKMENVLNIGPQQSKHAHGYNNKDMLVFHETVSPDYRGWADIKGVSEYLGKEDYGIHGIVDLEGNKAWASGQGKAIFYHTASAGRLGNGNVNTRAIGVELISRVMLDYPDNLHRWRAWWKRVDEIEEAAKLGAWITRTHNIPLVLSDGSKPGITTHWQVSKHYDVPGGHTDCWPKHLGGYFPEIRLLNRIIYYRGKGY